MVAHADKADRGSRPVLPSLSLSLFDERCDVRTSFGSVVVRRVQRLRIYLLDYTDYTLLTNGQEPGLA